MLTKRQVLLKYGFNEKTFRRLIAAGVLRVVVKEGRRSSVFVPEEELLRLVEGEHYILCAGCGARQFQITTKHLRFCSGMTLEQYRVGYPEASVLSGFSAKNKAKTSDQRAHQSRVLRQRFQTPEGQITRFQISESSKRMHAAGYRAVATGFLRSFNQKNRVLRRTQMQKRWRNSNFRALVEQWHVYHREQSLTSISHARTFIETTSKLHLRFKKALEQAGIVSSTEYKVGWYSVDEAILNEKIAIEIDGCYWHGCFECGFSPRNYRLDRAKTTFLQRSGWVVLRLWEHELNENEARCVDRVRGCLEHKSG